MNDRELLEMAARAAGIIGVWHERGQCIHVTDCAGMSDLWWRPLDDDGDALRLVAKLKLSIDFMDGSVWRRELDHSLVLEYFGGDHDPCYRRAITRAAAAIGSAM